MQTYPRLNYSQKAGHNACTRVSLHTIVAVTVPSDDNRAIVVY